MPHELLDGAFLMFVFAVIAGNMPAPREGERIYTAIYGTLQQLAANAPQLLRSRQVIHGTYNPSAQLEGGRPASLQDRAIARDIHARKVAAGNQPPEDGKEGHAGLP